MSKNWTLDLFFDFLPVKFQFADGFEQGSFGLNTVVYAPEKGVEDKGFIGQDLGTADPVPGFYLKLLSGGDIRDSHFYTNLVFGRKPLPAFTHFHGQLGPDLTQYELFPHAPVFGVIAGLKWTDLKLSGLTDQKEFRLFLSMRAGYSKSAARMARFSWSM